LQFPNCQQTVVLGAAAAWKPPFKVGKKFMGAKKIDVLLIGWSSTGCSPLSIRLRNRGCDCLFAISSQEVCRVLDRRSFDLVLSPIILNGECLDSLIGRLEGSDVTLFYSEARNDGCWWLPALWLGANCFGAPALSHGKFVTVLDETIEKIRSSMRTATDARQAIAARLACPVVTIPFSRRVSLSSIPMTAKSQELIAFKNLGQ
jgi:hypothetical protein